VLVSAGIDPNKFEHIFEDSLCVAHEVAEVNDLDAEETAE
jgi:hypothetical protein